jgi:hypothetical protein
MTVSRSSEMRGATSPMTSSDISTTVIQCARSGGIILRSLPVAYSEERCSIFPLDAKFFFRTRCNMLAG